MRRQLPALSPVSPRALWRASGASLRDPAGAVRSLEDALAVGFDARRVLITASGTDALRMAIETTMRAAGDPTRPVALPAFSCFDLVTAAVGAGVDMVFYDVDPISLAPDMESLAGALEARPLAVVIANLFAFPVDWDAVRAVCDASGAALVEDAAQGLGSAWDAGRSGTFGDLSVLSFGRGKGWTGGSGGALLARRPGDGFADPRPAVDRAPGTSARLVAALGAQWLLGRPSLYWLPASVPWLALGETRYKEPSDPGRPPAFAAALAREMEDRSVREVEARRACAERWRDIVTDAAPEGLARPCDPLEGGVAGYLRFPVLLDGGEGAERVAHRAGRYGVVRGYPVALDELEASRGRTLLAGRPMPGARRLSRDLVTLPCHGRVTETDYRGVAEVLRGLAARTLPI
jgi:dTDP-4-amino-4,6-dideoxygalactose transaminase